MIKEVLLLALILQAFSISRTTRLNYYDEIVINNLVNGKDITVTLDSLPGNDPTIPIAVQLRQIQNLVTPFASTQKYSSTCTFATNAAGVSSCSVSFTAPVINTAYKYTLRLEQSTTLHYVNAHVSIAGSDSTKPAVQCGGGNVFLTPKGATNPGFKFYINAPGTWKASFKVISSPAPTVSSFDFSLWSLNGVVLTSSSTNSVITTGDVSFTITTAGYYYLSFGLQVSAITATTQYPVALEFTFEDNVCPSDQYISLATASCKTGCASVTNSKGTSTGGACECNDKFFWKPDTNQCIACPAAGCPNASAATPPPPPSNGGVPPPPPNGQNGTPPPPPPSNGGASPSANGKSGPPPPSNQASGSSTTQQNPPSGTSSSTKNPPPPPPPKK